MPRSRSTAIQSERSRLPVSGCVNEMVTRIQASPADRVPLSSGFAALAARLAAAARIWSAYPL
jgi:hypothetical protein